MPLSLLTVNMVGTGLPRHKTLTVVLHWSGTPRPGAPKPPYTRYVSYESPRTDAWGLLFAALPVPVQENQFFPYTIVVTATDPTTGHTLARFHATFAADQ